MSHKIVFNHFYRLKHDSKRSYILATKYPESRKIEWINSTWTSKVHPYFAMVFSLLSEPVEQEEAVRDIAYFLEITEEKAEEMLAKFLNNPEELAYDYEGTTNLFPRNIVIDADKAFVKNRKYTPEQFNFQEIDLEHARPYLAPSTLVWMVNNTCVTNCAYCYADKQTRSEVMPFERMQAVIEEADHLGISDIFLTGGEFFLYKEWDALLKKMFEHGYRPELISTKVPITEPIVKKMKEYGLRVQVSFDALDEPSLIKILEVKEGYLERMKRTIGWLDQYEVTYQVATVLTKYNSSLENLNRLHTFLSRFPHLARWDVRVAFRSLYSRENFDEIKIKREKIEEIARWVEETKKTSGVHISWSGDDDDTYFKATKGSKNFAGSRCSASSSNLVILPDGKATVCEQLYWNSRFIVGDVTKQSLTEIWNSPESLNLYRPAQEEVKPESACRKCKLYDDCISNANRCIVNIIKAYGDDNFDYPDPRCNQAPPFIHTLLHV